MRPYFRHTALSLALATVCFAASIVPALAVTNQVKNIQFNPATQTFQIKSSGPVRATVNAVNIGKTKRVIIDVENAEISMDLPRDPMLLQALSAKLGTVKNISVNQFGGAKPIVRILLDVEGINFTAALPKSNGDLIELKLVPNEPVVAAQPPATTTAAAKPNVSTTGSYPELKKTLSNLNLKYDQLQSENQQLRSQLQQFSVNRQTQDINVSEVQRLRDANQSLQTQLSALYQDKDNLSEQLRELNKSRTELTQAQTRIKSLQTENNQLRSRVNDTPETVTLPANPAGNISTLQLAQMQKQVADLRRENDQLRLSVKSASGGDTPDATTGNELKRQVEQAKEAMARSITTINEQNKEIAYLKKQVDQLQTGIDVSSKEQLTVLNSKLDEKDSAIRQLQGQVNELSSARRSEPDTNQSAASLVQKDRQLQALQQQLAQAQNELAQARSQTGNTEALTQKDRQLQAMQQQLVQVQKELDQARVQTGSSDELNAVKQQLASVESQYKSAVAQFNRDQADLARQLEDMKIATSANAEPQGPAPQMSAKESQQLSQYEKEVAALKNKLRATEINYDQAIADVKRLEEQKNQLAKTATQPKTAGSTKTLETRLRERENRLVELQDKLAMQEEQLGQLRNQLKESSTQQQSMATAETMPKAVSGDAALVKENKRLQNVVDLLKRDNQMLVEDKAEIARKIKALEEQRRGLSEQLASTKKQGGKTTASSDLANTKVEQLNKELDRIKADNETLMADKVELSKKLSDLQASGSAQAGGRTTRASAGDASRIRSLEGQLKSRDNDLAELQGRMDDLRQQLAVAKQTKGTGKTGGSNENLAMLQEKDQEIATLKTQLKSMSAKVDESSDSLNRMQAQMQKQDKKGGIASTTASAAGIGSDNSGQAEKHYKLGQDFDNNSQRDLAYQEYSRAIRLDPANSKYMYAASIALAGQQKYDEATQLLQEYIDAHPYQPDAFNQLGKIYLLSGQLEEAKTAFSKAVPVNVLNNYASALKKLGKISEAERVFKLAIEINPSDSDILFNLGNIYNTSNNLSEARSTYNQALTIRPNFAEAHYNLGLVYSKMGDKSNAVTHLEKFLELSPNASNADTIRTYIKKLKG